MNLNMKVRLSQGTVKKYKLMAPNRSEGRKPLPRQGHTLVPCVNLLCVYIRVFQFSWDIKMVMISYFCKQMEIQPFMTAVTSKMI